MTPKRIGRGVLFVALVIVSVFVHGCCESVGREQVDNGRNQAMEVRYISPAGVHVPLF